MTSADSMKVDSTALYYTLKGRKVYGGGGIIPDIFTPMDTTRATKFFIDCNKKAVMMRFASNMFDKYSSALSKIDNFKRLDKWMVEVGVEQQFLDYAAAVENLRPSAQEWEETKWYMMPQVKALIGRYSKLQDEAFYRFYHPIDNELQTAITAQ